MKKHVRTVRDFFIRYERRLASASLLVGFIVDTLTLRRIDLISNQLILVWYLLVLGTGITLINAYQVSIRPSRWLERIYVYLPIIVQFAFGNLFSGFMVLYSRSTSLIASWPFILLFFLLLIGNELFQPYYLRFRFQSALFFFALLSFFIVYIPLITGTLGIGTFILSIVVASAVFLLLLYALSLKLPALIAREKSKTLMTIGGIIAVIILFYGTNVIPPIPLSLEDGGAYHSIERTGAGYRLTHEYGAGGRFLGRFFTSPTLHLTPGASVYVYSSVFAPTKLSATIVHNWQWFDESKSRWVSLSDIAFPISGGRDEGYRGYSTKNVVPEGHWRVDVQTENGRVIGRIKFNVTYVEELPRLFTTLRQ